MLMLVACCLGTYVGLHFSILALLPLSFLGAGALVASSWSSGPDLSESLMVSILPAFTLQAGYMIGLSARGAYCHFLVRFNDTQSRLVKWTSDRAS
jgi:hypothetical protein